MVSTHTVGAPIWCQPLRDRGRGMDQGRGKSSLRSTTWDGGRGRLRCWARDVGDEGHPPSLVCLVPRAHSCLVLTRASFCPSCLVSLPRDCLLPHAKCLISRMTSFRPPTISPPCRVRRITYVSGRLDPL